MKFIGSFVALLLVFVAGLASAQTAPAKPDSVKFNLYTDPVGHIYQTVFNVGNEKIVHHRKFFRNFKIFSNFFTGEWKEDITISSPTLVARKFPISGPTTLASGFPDGYEIKSGRWNQFVPPDVPTVVLERYKQYLRIARDLSAGNWPGVFPRW